MFRKRYIQYATESNNRPKIVENELKISKLDPASFRLVHEGIAANLYVSAEDYEGVRRAAGDLQCDIGRVTGVSPRLVSETSYLQQGHAVLIGTIGQCPVIDALIAEGKLQAGEVAGKWEAFVIQTVANPLSGLDSALVIAGSDKRGTIFGIYDVSENIGVSPWHWWADVPPAQRETIHVIPGTYIQGEPSVKYRGIFLNDEGPSLMAWVRANYRDFTHEFYENVYELLLRLKANYLWPAMWDNTFYEDDPRNAEIADHYGIVIGTSHHEPMQRPHGDWKKHRQGPWDYSVNERVLHDFWEEGIRRSRAYESIVTLGMRGDGDEAMGGHLNFEQKIALLERIVEDQRNIIAEQTGKAATEVPQLWALYKEVQDYYDHGMRVPDDITLLWSDDNHGNLRRVPTEEERGRSGGAGIYYHLDYVGGPRSYKWLNTVPIPKIWEQMHKACEYGADRIWILNVGDLKPMEFPMEYFLRMAWNISDFTRDNARGYTEWWAERQFGADYSVSVANLLDAYTKFNGRIKPELLNAVELYSLTHYKEAETAITDFSQAVQAAQQLHAAMPEDMRDAFFQLVLYPVEASAQVLELHLRAARSRLYARQGRTMANVEAREAELLFAADRELTFRYNKLLAEGKWDHMMDQNHIGYTYWNQPPENVMPETGYVEELDGSEMGVAIEGSQDVWPGASAACELPQFDAFTREARYIEIFNRKSQPFVFQAHTDEPWIKLSMTEGTVVHQKRLWVDIDWTAAPVGGTVFGRIVLTGPDETEVAVHVPVFYPTEPTRQSLVGHMETGGFVSIEAEHYGDKEANSNGVAWEKISCHGRTLSSMAVFPVTTACAEQPDFANSPSLTYPVYLTSTGEFKATLYLAPSLDFVPGQGLRIGVSLDDGRVQIADAISHTSEGGFDEPDWEQSVIYNLRTASVSFHVEQPGQHTLRVWMVDPIVVLQKIVLDAGGVKPSLLGPPESWHSGRRVKDAMTKAMADHATDASKDASDPCRVPGILAGVRAASGPFDVFVRSSGLYTLELAAIVKPGDSPMIRVLSGGRDLAGPLRLRHAQGESGSLRYLAEGIPLSAGRHTLRLEAEGCRALQEELRLTLAVPDRLAVRPSLRRSGLLPDLPLTAQIGLLSGAGTEADASCRYAMTVSLYM
ncbi:glycosyl hydrolase family 115 (putative glucuronidase) [Fontibacillus phaseoli]|uniref:Glycosyl hydrolase family 115 (Putative glucuronidase) n=1 Tax=Fontibacillus phaseoli TaxID=1416533 RepID=A0A369B870_9BACL|nr:glycosyl hydrolase 115 family protein [Fontibacillus phaseoli]RCX16746.1 glycosyl hydrolase family 115 (putative glucuronidase) [Fontibacillus phaseoli]